jgi:predicted nucleotidyltransferase
MSESEYRNLLREMTSRCHQSLMAINSVAAIFLIGSLAQGNDDESSDIDLCIVVNDNEYYEMVSSIPEIASSLGPFCVGGHVFGPKSYSAIYIYGHNIVKVDFDLCTIAEFPRLIEDSFSTQTYLYNRRTLFDRDGLEASVLESMAETFSVVADEEQIIGFVIQAISALKMIKRGELFEAYDILNHLRDPFLTKLLCTGAKIPFENYRRIENKLTKNELLRLYRTIAIPKPSDLLIALKELIEFYQLALLKNGLRTSPQIEILLSFISQQIITIENLSPEGSDMLVI